MDVRQNTTLRNGDMAQKLVQLLVITNSELQVARDDTGLLVVASSITGQFENLSSKIFKNSSEVDRGTWVN